MSDFHEPDDDLEVFDDEPLDTPGFESIAKMDIYERIAEISAQLRYIAKGSTIRGKSKGGTDFSYKGVSHDDVVARLQPYFAAYHIHAFPSITDHSFNEAKSLTVLTLNVEFRCLDYGAKAMMTDPGLPDTPPLYKELPPRPGGVFTTTVIGYGQDYGDKGVGKAYSYGFKYALLKTFFLETGEDDEQRAVEPESRFLTAVQYRDLLEEIVERDVDEDSYIETLNQRVLKQSIGDLTELPLRYYEGAMSLLRKKRPPNEQPSEDE